ncbi:hypothetical protein ACA910_008904 [Epithemia clementina (nom. ined.)]
MEIVTTTSHSSTSSSTTATVSTTTTSSTDGLPRKNRSEARDQVALAWQQRRQQQEQDKAAAARTAAVITKRSKNNISPVPPLGGKHHQHHPHHGAPARRSSTGSSSGSSSSGSYHGGPYVKQKSYSPSPPPHRKDAHGNIIKPNPATNTKNGIANINNNVGAKNNWFFSALSSLAQNANGLKRCTAGSCQQQQHYKQFVGGNYKTIGAKPREVILCRPPPAVTRGATNQTHQQHHSKNKNIYKTATSDSSSLMRQQQQPRRYDSSVNNYNKNFPSMLALHQASALSRQIQNLLLRSDEEIPEDYDEDRNDDGEDDGPTSDNNSKGDGENSVEGGSKVTKTGEPRNKKSSKTSDEEREDSNQSLLAILSTQYNLETAVFEMAQSRSRAFWLIDLRTVVDRLVEWKRQYATLPSRRPPTPPAEKMVVDHKNSPTTTMANHFGSTDTTSHAPPVVRFLFRVSANSHPVLLRVLTCCFDDIANQVRLVTGNAWDLAQAHKFVGKTMNHNKSTSATSAWLDILDDSTMIGKPDAYLRKALLAENQVPIRMSGVAVDGPEEAHRVWSSLQRAASRLRRRRAAQGGKRGNDNKEAGELPLVNDSISHSWIEDPSLRVCLRFKSGSDPSTWPQLWDDTQAALDSFSSSCRIEAVSMDASELLSSSNDGPVTTLNPTILQALCACLLNKNNHSDHCRIRLELTGQLELEKAQRMEFLKTLQQHPVLVSNIDEICIDITAPLLSSAGALCTRVIGVREQFVEKKSTNNENVEEQPKPERVRRLHYYIDDGCYGSLYQEGGGGDGSSSLKPVPLITTTRTPISTGGDELGGGGDSNNEQQQDALVVSTVWGPTCDGLDRVCTDIELPELRRDDWLVFPIQFSGEGLGTAFNGFCPPDTAYCVLGYFRD